ncbi:MAG: FAD-binding domain-containing protein [Pseudomonadota bacterium]
MPPAPSIVWFKRDLRAVDHAPLARAAAAGPVIPLYIAEPGLWAQADAAGRQWAFIAECLDDLARDLATAGAPLLIHVGDAVDVLDAVARQFGVRTIYAHQETGNAWTYGRDKRVAAWAKARGIAFIEEPQGGVVRRLKSRNGWARRWDRTMAQPATPRPALTAPAPLEATPRPPSARDLGLAPDPCPERQRGGRAAGLAALSSFLTERGRSYRRAMSAPGPGAVACSRLSAHLAYGALSMREVAQAAWARQTALADAAAPDGRSWRGSMQSFTARLHWRHHFMQKLEDEPALEHRNLHPAYDGMRPETPDAGRLAAWSAGETGLPFVDACMRSLAATGWINFRMRAMLVAVASYHLWLDWRASGAVLARLFTDYEPGIHWPQMQMQSGTTGINTVRIYNPIKQGRDQDPDGAFTRRWLPELAAVPDAHLQEPWTWSGAGGLLGKRYPHPIVDVAAAARAAKERVYAVRRQSGYGPAADAIQAKHGSRKSGMRQVKRPRKQTRDSRQLSFDL